MPLQSIEKLSSQQKEVLNLLTEGLGNVQIAQRRRVSLEVVGTMLDDLYGSLGIEPSLPKQEKRGIAINHSKRSGAGLTLFEQTTPASLLEGLTPWQRQALTGIAHDRKVEEIAAEAGVSIDDVEVTLARFMVSAKVSTRDKAVNALKQVIQTVAEPIAPERGYSVGHDKPATQAKPVETNAEQVPVGVPAINLNARERKVLKLIEQGKNNNEVAEAINAPMSTVHNVMADLYSRFGLKGSELGKIEKRRALVKHYLALANPIEPQAQATGDDVSQDIATSMEESVTERDPQGEVIPTAPIEPTPTLATPNEESAPVVASTAPAEQASSNNVECTLTLEQAFERIVAAGRPVLSERSLQRYCLEGRLVAQKARTALGSEWLINEASLSSFIESEPLAREGADSVAVGSGGNTFLKPPTNIAEKKENRYQLARDLVIRTRNCTNFFIRRKLGMGGPEFKEVIQRLEDEGVVGKIGSGDRGSRQILIPQPQDALGQESDSATGQTRQSRPSFRSIFSDQEKIEKLQELLLVVGDNSELGQILGEVIDDLERMEKMRQIIKLLKEE